VRSGLVWCLKCWCEFGLVWFGACVFVWCVLLRVESKDHLAMILVVHVPGQDRIPESQIFELFGNSIFVVKFQWYFSVYFGNSKCDIIVYD
jgi:hypothetical protein